MERVCQPEFMAAIPIKCLMLSLGFLWWQTFKKLIKNISSPILHGIFIDKSSPIQTYKAWLDRKFFAMVFRLVFRICPMGERKLFGDFRQTDDRCRLPTFAGRRKNRCFLDQWYSERHSGISSGKSKKNTMGRRKNPFSPPKDQLLWIFMFE